MSVQPGLHAKFIANGDAPQEEGPRKKVASLSRTEQVLLRWADYDGQADRCLLPHHGPDHGHKWTLLRI